MRETRTIRQIEANKLDLEMFNLVRRVERFCDLLAGSDRAECRKVVREINGNRSSVRKHMHRKDREATDA